VVEEKSLGLSLIGFECPRNSWQLLKETFEWSKPNVKNPY
jgi:hypothetical protein